ncbi:hypothetical protein [Providencia heimbachae]|uniref:hypothetical protein n=2 Tax=Providencia heimbachae TaxID=333962 RepID=UPI000838EA0D|nr:hypothetical protein [Providencia heimbachae]NIH24408.1 hypothetical protein [Providencia heimbachae]
MKNLLSMTKKVFIISLTTLLLIPVLSTMSAHAETNQHSGTINFSGSIVHPPCFNEINEQKITLNCLNDKADMTSSHLDLNHVTKTEGWKVINDGRGEYTYNWVNEEQKLGMLTIKYI